MAVSSGSAGLIANKSSRTVPADVELLRAIN
jgi:hypothetical protein